MSEWQPIETAPRDGTHFLTYRPDRIQEAWWKSDSELGGFGFTYAGYSFPTHWMPLPKPPIA